MSRDEFKAFPELRQKALIEELSSWVGSAGNTWLVQQ